MYGQVKGSDSGFRALSLGLGFRFYGSPRVPVSLWYMGGCQNYGPFWGTLNDSCRIIIGTQKGTIMLTTTHILIGYFGGLSVYHNDTWTLWG